MPQPELLTGIPIKPIDEFYREIHGKPPSGIIWKAFLEMNRSAATLQRLAMLPEGTPDRVFEQLRTAWSRLESDEAYKADANKIHQFVPYFLSGAQAQKVFLDNLDFSPEVLEYLKDLVKRGQ